MARTPRDITDAELAVLEVLWREGELPVRRIAETLYPGGGASEIATVQKLCERLLEKRLVHRNRGVRPTRFAAAVDRAELIGRQLQGVADKLCEGSFTPLLTHLVESADLAPDDLQALRDQVAKLDAARRSKHAKPEDPR